MLSVTVLFTSVLVGFAAAQNSSSTVNLSGVDMTTLNQWCQSERNNCPLLCGGPKNMKTNICNGNDLQNYQCICNNGSAPANIANYTDTVPYNICQYEFKQCRITTPGSQSCQACGTLAPSSVPQKNMAASSSSSSSSATDTASATGASASASTTAKGIAPKMGVEHAIGGVAVGLVAAVGMLL